MKRIFTIITVVILTVSVLAQSPQKMSYQAVIRNNSGEVVANTQVGVEINIRQGSASGTIVYTETQTPTTNSNGLISIEIGSEAGFSSISWETDSYYIETKTAIEAPLTSYTITGVSQILSVPYALQAKKAENGITTAQANEIAANTLKVGYTDALVSANADVVANTAKVGVTPGASPGEMQYWDGSEWVTLAPGTTGQVLTISNGVPTWGAPGMGMGTNDVYNARTGKIWMDRNLGATQVATTSTDAASYGDLYQWGRGTDGHQVRTSGTTSTKSSSDTPGHGDFIIADIDPYDWRSPQNSNLWQGVDGINNPCPSGYRLPTEAELDAERLSWSSNNIAGALASPLRLPAAGLRQNWDGSLFMVGTSGNYWSSTVNGTRSWRLLFYSSNTDMISDGRAFGYSIRCIKE